MDVSNIGIAGSGGPLAIARIWLGIGPVNLTDDRNFAACYHQPVDHVARRLEDALELADMAERMVRARLQREHPNLRGDALEARVRAWLRSRPCAVDGDADGRPVDLEQPT